MSERNGLITDRFGPCPKCGTADSKVLEGKNGEFFKMVCVDGHPWTYNFPKEEPKPGGSGGWELRKLAEAAVSQATYFVGSIRKCDLCKGTAHKEGCALGKIEELLEGWGHPINFDDARKGEVEKL